MEKRKAKGDKRGRSRLCGRRVDEGCRGTGARRGKDRVRGWKRSKPPSLDGERRENEDGGLCSMTPITLSSSTFVGTRHTRVRDTEIQMHAAYCDGDRKNGMLDVRWQTRPVNVVGLPPSREGNRVATGHKNEDAGGATSARRKNPPYISLLAGTRVIGREKEKEEWMEILDRR